MRDSVVLGEGECEEKRHPKGSVLQCVDHTETLLKGEQRQDRDLAGT